MSQMAQLLSTSSSPDTDLLQLTVKTALARVEKHAPQEDKALLRAMLEYAPSDEGKSSIASHILQSGDVKDVLELDQLADSYWVNVILAVRSAAGKTPIPSQNPSPGDPLGGATPFNAEYAKRNLRYIKKHALARDDYCCLASGRIDYQVFTYKPDFVVPQFAHLEVTQAAHIIPSALSDFDDNNKNPVEHKMTIWTALQVFCGNDISMLRGAGIHSIENVMTLSATLLYPFRAYKYFSELQVAFEAVPDVPDKYKIVTFGKVAPRLGFPKTVTLRSATGQSLPNPFYLATHCSICKVLWASGRAEALEETYSEWQDMSVLAEDGGSAEVLKLALQLKSY